VHGVGGAWGTIATGLLAEKAVNPAGADGLFFGGLHQFLVQLALVGVTVLYAAVVTFVLFKVIDALLGMKVDKKSEILGLDLSQQCESAYTVVD